MKKLFNELFELFFEVLQVFIEPGKHFLRWLIAWTALIAGSFSFYYFGEYMLEMWKVVRPEKFIAVFLPFVLPIVLLKALFESYMRYIRLDYINRQGFALLEIKIPKETNRSPLAMEIILTSLYHTGSATMIQAYKDGNIRSWFSLEMVSFGGEVHFFIWCMKKWKNLVEAQLYAQYPTIEIHEVDDYAEKIHHDNSRRFMWGTYFKLEKPDVYPIKTYVDYGLDKPDLKEEYKIDPMTSVLEYLGSLRKGEQAWIQILIQAHRKERLIDAEFLSLDSFLRFFKLKPDWKKEIDEEIEKVREESMVEQEVGEGIVRKVPHPTDEQKEAIKALVRSKDKLPFEVAIRGFYIADNEVMNPISITGLIGSFRQYNSNNLNGFKLGWYTDPDYPWRDFRRIRRDFMEEEMLEAYKLRSFFRPPFNHFQGGPFILTTEELATIYHFPGGVAQTPTLERIMSKKAEPPPNLPV